MAELPATSVIKDAFPESKRLGRIDRALDLLKLSWFRLIRRQIPTHASGTYAIPRYRGLAVDEHLTIPEPVGVHNNIEKVMKRFSEAGDQNPCISCHVMLEAISVLSMRSGEVPEEMEKVQVNCRPDQENTGFYEVLGTHGDVRVRMKNISCLMHYWLSNYRIK